MRAPTDHLALPFFDPAHQQLGQCLADWMPQQSVDEQDDRAACRQWVRLLGDNQWLRYCVPKAHGGVFEQLDSRALVILRETLAFHSPLADFAFAMQGLGSGAISLAGTPAQQAAYLPAVARGDKIAAFALSEVDAGSDVAAMKTVATKCLPTWTLGGNDAQNAVSSDGAGDGAGNGAGVGDGNRDGAGHYALNGSKTWISNGGMADFYLLFAKTDPAAGTRGISAFIVDATTRGLDASEHITVMSPHPLASLKLTDCVVSDSARVGAVGGGFKLAMQTLDIFRASVAGAALGMARRAMAQALHYASTRQMFGQSLADFQLTQAKLGDMAALIDAAALLTYRAAWLRDTVGTADAASASAYSSAAAMAKMTATENAQRVIDMAVQMHGGQGVRVGSKVEALYRDIRSLRIYEGATEVQQLIIGKAALKAVKTAAA
jgi:acyl-CoA dehydrogenase